MHERSPKNSAIDTLLYERDMLRHCAETIYAKRQRFQKNFSDEDAVCEYYLGIEGFLLHFRNLLGFFINKGSRSTDSTDLTIARTTSWSNGRPVDERITEELTKRAGIVNQSHGLGKGDCYRKISWFLQHCTTHRHQETRSWDIERMFADIESVLDDFVKHFVSSTDRIKIAVPYQKTHSTSTITKAVIPAAVSSGKPTRG